MKKTTIVDFSIIACILILFTSCKFENKNWKLKELTVSEGLVNPMGFYDASPSFSWKLPEGVREQGAYAISVASSPDLLPGSPDLWESGKINSPQSLFVQYQGKELSSKQKVYWQVKFWDNEGVASAWSELAHFELKVTVPSNKSARIIVPANNTAPFKDEWK